MKNDAYSIFQRVEMPEQQNMISTTGKSHHILRIVISSEQWPRGSHILDHSHEHIMDVIGDYMRVKIEAWDTVMNRDKVSNNFLINFIIHSK